MILEAIAAVAGAYQTIAAIACWRFAKRVQKPAAGGLPASILKPIHGLDAGLRPALESHSRLTGDYELLCGVRSLSDPAVPVIREFPRARIVECSTEARNGKVGILADLAREARHEILIVNDADIRVDPDYIAHVTAPLRDPKIGLVTCLYRANGATLAARFEGLGVVTDFAPSTLVGWLLGFQEFAGGSTLAFRRADLERIGGFAGIGDYLADDYQLGARIRGLGLKTYLSETIVATHLGGSWRDVWRHQVRWARTIRVSNFAGYLSLPVTFATLWGIVAIIGGAPFAGLALLAIRMIAALVSGILAMRSRDAILLWFLIPFRDLFGFAVWTAGVFGHSVIWSGRRLSLDPQGRIR